MIYRKRISGESECRSLLLKLVTMNLPFVLHLSPMLFKEKSNFSGNKILQSLVETWVTTFINDVCHWSLTKQSLSTFTSTNKNDTCHYTLCQWGFSDRESVHSLQFHRKFKGSTPTRLLQWKVNTNRLYLWKSSTWKRFQNRRLMNEVGWVAQQKPSVNKTNQRKRLEYPKNFGKKRLDFCR